MRIELTTSEFRAILSPTLEPAEHVTPFTPTLPPDLVKLSTIRLVKRGLIIDAIKEHRASTNVSLKESKDIIDLIRSEQL